MVSVLPIESVNCPSNASPNSKFNFLDYQTCGGLFYCLRLDYIPGGSSTKHPQATSYINHVERHREIEPMISMDSANCCRENYKLKLRIPVSHIDKNSTEIVSVMRGKYVNRCLTKLMEMDSKSVDGERLDYILEIPITYSSCLLLMDGYFFSYLAKVVQLSPILSHNICRNFASLYPTYTVSSESFNYPNMQMNILIRLKPPLTHYIDYYGNEMATTLLQEKVELDCALSWLSTLGGASSSLGENSVSWAVSAGQISLQQLKLAMRMNDPLITSRCMIYISLSFIQRGYLHRARRILEVQYKRFLGLQPGIDVRLGKMCHGVWNKLKHSWNSKYVNKIAVVELYKCELQGKY